MRRVNIWIALRTQAHNAVKARLNWDTESQGDYGGPVPNWVARLFSQVDNIRDVDKRFRSDRRWLSGGAVWRRWHIWSLTFSIDRLGARNLLELLQDLEQQFPSMVEVVGAWHWDGRQVGTRWDGMENVMIDEEIVDPSWDGIVPTIEVEDAAIPGETVQMPDPNFVVPKITVQTQTSRPAVKGTPLYPLASRLIEYMPDNPDGSRPTEPFDVQLLLGQRPRRFD